MFGLSVNFETVAKITWAETLQLILWTGPPPAHCVQSLAGLPSLSAPTVCYRIVASFAAVHESLVDPSYEHRRNQAADRRYRGLKPRAEGGG